MGHFWASFFEHVRNCGRNAPLFLIALAGVFILLSLGAILYATGAYVYVLPPLGLVVLIAFLWLILNFRRTRAQRRRPTPIVPLSDLELRRARSKLRRT